MNIQQITKLLSKAKTMSPLAKIGVTVAGIGCVFGAGALTMKFAIGDKFEKANAEIARLENLISEMSKAEKTTATESPNEEQPVVESEDEPIEELSIADDITEKRASSGQSYKIPPELERNVGEYVIPQNVEELRNLANKMKLDQATIEKLVSYFGYNKYEFNMELNSIRHRTRGGEWYPCEIEEFYSEGNRVKVISTRKEENGLEMVTCEELKSGDCKYKKHSHNPYCNTVGASKETYHEYRQKTSYYKNSDNKYIKISEEKVTPNSHEYILDLSDEEIISGMVYDEEGNILETYNNAKGDYFDFNKYIMTREQQEAKVKKTIVKK